MLRLAAAQPPTPPYLEARSSVDATSHIFPSAFTGILTVQTLVLPAALAPRAAALRRRMQPAFSLHPQQMGHQLLAGSREHTWVASEAVHAA